MQKEAFVARKYARAYLKRICEDLDIDAFSGHASIVFIFLTP